MRIVLTQCKEQNHSLIFSIFWKWNECSRELSITLTRVGHGLMGTGWSTGPFSEALTHSAWDQQNQGTRCQEGRSAPGFRAGLRRRTKASHRGKVRTSTGNRAPLSSQPIGRSFSLRKQTCVSEMSVLYSSPQGDTGREMLYGQLEEAMVPALFQQILLSGGDKETEIQAHSPQWWW